MMSNSHRGYGILPPPAPPGFALVGNRFMPPGTVPMSTDNNVSNVHAASLNLKRNASVGGVPGRRYGSNEQGKSGPRGRSRVRSRERADHTMNRTISSLRQMGPQETMDWDQMMDDVLSRVETMENNNRRQAQHLADQTGRIDSILDHLRDYSTDIVKYKEYVETSFKNCDSTVTTNFTNIGSQLQSHDTSIATTDNNFTIAEARLQSLADSIEELKNHIAMQFAKPRGPDHFNLTPQMNPAVATSVPEPNVETDDPGNNGDILRAQQSSTAGPPLPQAFPGCGPPAKPLAALIRTGEQPPRQRFGQGVHPVPGSFGPQANGGLEESPFDEDKELGRTMHTPMRPTHDGLPSPSNLPRQQNPGPQYGDNRAFPYAPVQATATWEPSYKENKLLTLFLMPQSLTTVIGLRLSSTTCRGPTEAGYSSSDM